MELEHSFTIPVPVEKAWPVLLDIRQVAPCMPGASVDSVDGDDFTGSVKVKLGPINLTYKGQAKFVEKDEANHKAVIDARGRDSRGNGTAAATITATLNGKGDTTECKVITDLNITGKPAQFGRGVMVDVGNKLIGQFADCLAGKLGGDSDEETETEAEAQAKQVHGGGPDSKPAPARESESDTAPAAAAAGAAGAAHVVSPDSDAKAEASGAAPDKTPVNKPDAQASDSKPDTGKDSGTDKAADDKGAADKGTADKGPTTSAPAPTPEAAPTPSPAAPSKPVQSVPAHNPEPIDLLHLAGGSVAKRAVPAAAVLAALIALIVFLTRKKS